MHQSKFLPRRPPQQWLRRCLHKVSVTEDHVLQTLLKLKPDKSPGPDNIHPIFLRETAYNIALPLTLIFRKSLDEGVLPEEWKCANITPIHKKGLRSEAQNYRPISDDGSLQSRPTRDHNQKTNDHTSGL